MKRWRTRMTLSRFLWKSTGIPLASLLVVLLGAALVPAVALAGTGTTPTLDAMILEYRPSDGALASKTFVDLGGNEVVLAGVVDSSGSTVTTGYTDVADPDLDVLTLALSNGLAFVVEGGTAQDIGLDVAADPQDNIVVASTRNGSDYLEVTKYTPDLQLVFRRTITITQALSAAVAVDSQGNIIAGVGTQRGRNRVAKYDSSGTLLWTDSAAVSARGPIGDIAIGTGDNIYMAFPSQGVPTQQIVTKLSPAGVKLGEVSIDPKGPNAPIPAALAFDSEGNLLATFLGNRNVSGTNDMVTVKLDAALNEVARAVFDSGGNDMPLDVAVDTANNVIVTGYTGDTEPARDVRTIMYDPALNEVWSVTFDGGVGSDEGRGVGVDPTTGNVIVMGSSMRDAADDPPFASFNIEKAKIKFKKKANHDSFEVRGTFELAEISDGINPAAEEVVVTVGSYTEVIPPGSFVREDDDAPWEYEGPKGGITDMKIDVEKGTFRIKAKDLDMVGTTNPVTIDLIIGDDSGSTAVTMQVKKNKWEFKRQYDEEHEDGDHEDD